MKNQTDHTKSKELMIFVAHRLGHKSNYGATLLNKALYFIDNVHYLKTGKPISNLTYIKQDHGQTPEPSVFLRLKDELVDSGDLDFIITEYFGRLQKKLLAKREPNFDLFEKEEIALIDKVISLIADMSATEISEMSHKYPAWKSASDKEALPFYTFLLSSKTPTSKDIEWAKSQMPECLA